MNPGLDFLAEEKPDVRQQVADALNQNERNVFDWHWPMLAREEQLPPPGNWRIWMILAGRGFGKTRAGAEWVRMTAELHPAARIAPVSASLAEAHAVMVEGESGLMSVFPPEERPVFEPSLHRIRFANGAQAQLFSAAEPETMRGPQHSHPFRRGAEGVLREPITGDPLCPYAAGALSTRADHITISIGGS